MYRNMMSFENAMLDSNADGMEKILSENGMYAFFMEVMNCQY